MPVQPIQIQQFAERLLKNENCAEELRSAISRAYYGAYHEARMFLERVPGVNISTGSKGHGEVQHHFAGLPDAEVEKIGHHLSTLQGVRITADYRLTDKTVETIAEATIYVKLAAQIFRTIGSVKSSVAKFNSLAPSIKKNNSTLREGASQEKKA